MAEKKTNLRDRFHKYLEGLAVKNPEYWASKKLLYDLAKDKGYKYETIDEAFKELEDCVDIGVKFAGGVYYKCWPMTLEEKQDKLRQRKWFDSLGEPEQK